MVLLYMSLFRSCTTKRTLSRIHAHLLATGLQRDAFAVSKLIESYAKTGSVETARLVFDAFPSPDSFMWGVLIKSYVWNLLFTEAISLYHEMLCRQIQRSSFIFPPVLRACSGLRDVAVGEKIQGSIIKSGFESDGFVETSLLYMYGEAGSPEAARKIFDGMTERDVVSWSSMVSSCIRGGRAGEGLDMFSQMIFENTQPDSVMMLGVTQACADLGLLKQAKSVHGYIVRRRIEIDGSLENSLVAMYGKCGELESAEKLFQKASRRSVISWTAMISCYNQRSCFREALNTLVRMQESGAAPNSVTAVAVLLSCTRLRCFREGKSVHGFVIRRVMELDSDSLCTALINMYASFRKLGNCYNVFEAMNQKTVLSWNSLVTGCAQNEFSEEALTFFVRMHAEGPSPDSFTLSSSLSTCGHIGHFNLGIQIHGHIAKSGFQHYEFVQNSLVDMYSKCGSLDVAYGIFNQILEKDIITWNAMINGFAQKGGSVEAIVLFDQMHSKCLDMDSVTYLSAIRACSQLGSLGKGRCVHQKLITSGLRTDAYIETALTTMYAKCGDIQMARRVFDGILDKNVVAWSSIISAYGLHGLVNDAISLFSRMIASGIRPNEVTFLSILSACSHAGLVEEGQLYFDLMRHEFFIEPQLDHCTCMVDLLSRAGHIDRALDFIKLIPEDTNGSIWGALLNGCCIHHRTDVADAIQRKIFEAEPQNSGYYILLSNIYAGVGKWDDFGKVRTVMKEMGLRKAPGYTVQSK